MYRVETSKDRNGVCWNVVRHGDVLCTTTDVSFAYDICDHLNSEVNRAIKVKQEDFDFSEPQKIRNES